MQEESQPEFIRQTALRRPNTSPSTPGLPNKKFWQKQKLNSTFRADIIVVENEKQLDKIWPIKGELADLKAIVQYTGELCSQAANN